MFKPMSTSLIARGILALAVGGGWPGKWRPADGKARPMAWGIQTHSVTGRIATAAVG